jgi:hypothetical protein
VTGILQLVLLCCLHSGAVSVKNGKLNNLHSTMQEEQANRIWPIAGLSLLLLLSACASEPVGLKPPPEDPIKLRVINQSDTVIDVIDAKPCGADDSQYKTQMESIKPNQRIMLHIYQECVDLVALDAFGSALDELPGLRLNSNITWKIQSASP